MTANLFNSAGNLYWYRHDGRSDGTPRWTGRNEVGSGGWQNYTSTFGTGNFIYAIDPDGNLYRVLRVACSAVAGLENQDLQTLRG